MELYKKTAVEIASMIKSGEITCEDAVSASLKRIEAVDGTVKAFLRVDKDGAIKRARQLDKRLADGEDIGVLGGVPIAVKDNMTTKGHITTCASKILEGFTAPYTSGVVSRIENAGGVIVGRTNMDEFAMGSSCENSAYQKTTNPWNKEYAPGGSSGGSAACVAAGEVPISLGSDTGGSIRQPGSLCGVIGMKPTYGRVSRYGLVAFASSLDQIGPFAKTAEDAALMLSVIAGHDERDATSLPLDTENYSDACTQDISGLRIGLPEEFFAEGLSPVVEKSVRDAVKVFEDLGCTVKPVSLPASAYSVATYYIIATAEASSNLARYDGVHYGHRTSEPTDLIDMYSASREEGFGAEVKRRIMLGTYVLSSGYYDAYYLKALKVRTLIRNDFLRAWEDVDVILGPTSPTAGIKLDSLTDDPLSMYLSDIYTISANLARIPGTSIPCGFSSDGLPIGLQILAPDMQESRILALSAAFQKKTDFHKQVPSI